MSPETIARSVQRLNAAGVTWPTTHRVAVTVRLAGLADVIALGDGVLEGPEAARAAFGHVLRSAGRDADPAAALREISKVQRVLSVMDQATPVEEPSMQPPTTQAPASPAPESTATSGPRALPVRPVRRAVTEGQA